MKECKNFDEMSENCKLNYLQCPYNFSNRNQCENNKD